MPEKRKKFALGILILCIFVLCVFVNAAGAASPDVAVADYGRVVEIYATNSWAWTYVVELKSTNYGIARVGDLVGLFDIGEYVQVLGVYDSVGSPHFRWLTILPAQQTWLPLAILPAQQTWLPLAIVR